MKFTSVILALSAVVAMVHAAPLPDLPDTTKTVGGIGGGVGDVIPVNLPAGTLRKRFVDDVPPGVDLPVGPKSVSLAKRDLNKAIPTDFSIIQNTFQTVANDAGINLENALYAQVTTVLQEKFHLEITDIVNIDIQAAIHAPVRVAIGKIYIGLDNKIKNLVDHAVAGKKVNVKALAPKVISLITERFTAVVVELNASVAVAVQAAIKAANIKVAAAIHIGANLGMTTNDIKGIVDQVLYNLPDIQQKLLQDLVQ